MVAQVGTPIVSPSFFTGTFKWKNVMDSILAARNATSYTMEIALTLVLR